jgi:hypothetical protein
VLVTTISSSKAHIEMIDYTFLLPGKNDICKLRSAGTECWRESVSLFEAEWSEGRSCFREVKQDQTGAKRSVKIG